MKTPVTAFVFARGGSKGVVGKNLRILGDKPLIGWAIVAARNSRYIDRVVVSTDDKKIAEMATVYGAEVPFIRPAELATDTAREFDAWKHAVEFLAEVGTPVGTFVSVPPTAPLRSSDDIDRCIEALTDDVDVVVTIAEASRSPYFNMVTTNDQGMCRLVIPPNEQVFSRQQAPIVFDMTTVAYVVRPKIIQGGLKSLWDYRVRSIQIPLERALDIDTDLDLKIAECLLFDKEIPR